MPFLITESGSAQRQKNRAGEEFEMTLPVGISRNLWRQRIPSNNPMTRDKVALGRSLYFDKRLSIDGTVSCAACHDPANAFSDHSVVGTGVSNKVGTRNTPTILNAMFSQRLFWDGRVSSLEEQAKQPMSNLQEMGMQGNDAVVARVVTIPEYREAFKRVFRDEGITIDTIVKAIAAYERTQISANSPFDHFISGDAGAISEAQKRGWELFKGKAKCIECHAFSHVSPFFTDFEFHNTGIVAKDMRSDLDSLARKLMENDNARDNRSVLPGLDRQAQASASLFAHTKDVTELGRYLVTKQKKDIGAFKTPTLRDVELTTPYMHNGSEKTLIDVVRFYNRGGNASAHLDERMHPLNLSDEEMNELVEFMRALTSDDVLRQAQSSAPQTRVPVIVEPFRKRQR
jgi:cytochrome c peroxidase